MAVRTYYTGRLTVQSDRTVGCCPILPNPEIWWGWGLLPHNLRVAFPKSRRNSLPSTPIPRGYGLTLCRGMFA